MLVSNIVFIISLLLDGILTNFLPYMVSDLSLFTPLFSISSLILIYPLLKKDNKKFLIFSLIAGIIYDLFYTNLIFFNGFIFFILGFIIIKLYDLFGTGYIKLLFHIIIVIISYELLTAVLIFVFNLVPITIDKVLYKIGHSILLNLIYGEIIYLILKSIPKKYLKITMN